MSNGAGGANDPNDFLKDEYEKSIDLIKYYDDRHIDLLKFASGLSAGVPTVLFGFYGLSDNVALRIWDFTALIGILSAIGLLSIFAAMVRNRVYFVFPARQANVMRAALFNAAGANDINQMYTTPHVRMFDGFSTQTLQLAFVAMQAAFFFGVAAYAWRLSPVTFSQLQPEIWYTFAAFLLLAAWAGVYFLIQGRRDANGVIRGASPKKPTRKLRYAECLAALQNDDERRQFTQLLAQIGARPAMHRLVILSVYD